MPVMVMAATARQAMYELRRQTVAATKQLYDAGYKVFVIGFGSTMPLYLQNTLNWMAYYGGTVNPLVAQSGSTTGYNLPLGCNAKTPVPSACCNFRIKCSSLLSGRSARCYQLPYGHIYVHGPHKHIKPLL